MENVLHKVTVEVEEGAWLSFKALCVQNGVTVQRELGRLAEREARAAERRQAQRLGRSKAAKQALAKARVEFGS